MKSLMVKVVLLVVAWLFFLPWKASCDYYQYEDEKGTVSFTDNPVAIPKKSRSKQKIRDDDLSNPESSVMRVKINDNQVLVPVKISYRGNEIKANFILDTGASFCTISPELANRLNIDPEEGETILNQGIGGGIYAVKHTTLDYVLVGPNRKYDVDITIVKSGKYDGLLGMNFLRELRYHIDFNSSTIRWGD